MDRMNAFWVDVIIVSLMTMALLAYVGWVDGFQ